MKLKGILGALAPTLVNVATSGNPVANIAIKMAAKKLNMPETSTLEQIEELVEREPDKIPALTQTENELKAMEINLESFKVEVDDRKSARDHFSDDPMPKIFAMTALLGFLGYVYMVTIQPPDANDDGVVNLILGALASLVSGISAFFFGGSNGKK